MLTWCCLQNLVQPVKEYWKLSGELGHNYEFIFIYDLYVIKIYKIIKLSSSPYRRLVQSRKERFMKRRQPHLKATAPIVTASTKACVSSRITARWISVGLASESPAESCALVVRIGSEQSDTAGHSCPCVLFWSSAERCFWLRRQTQKNNRVLQTWLCQAPQISNPDLQRTSSLILPDTLLDLWKGFLPTASQHKQAQNADTLSRGK